MTATHISEITDQMISDRLMQVQGCTVEWTGHMPADSERVDGFARERLYRLSVAAVRKALDHDLVGDSPRDEVDMAISIAAEPAGLPDNACVALFFEDPNTCLCNGPAERGSGICRICHKMKRGAGTTLAQHPG